jgi:ABC-type phosphate transport system substrate-binding protein
MGPGGTALSKDQLANIYLGRTFDLKPVDLPEGNATRDQFYKKATDRDPAQVKAVWSRIIFTGKGQAPAVAADAAAVKKAVAADPKGIGYIEKAAVDGSVKVVLTLD